MSNDIESHLIENRVFIRRSGKIMRRLLKQIAGGGEITGDTTTLEDFAVLAKLRDAEE
jgi:acetyl-CoA synthetase